MDKISREKEINEILRRLEQNRIIDLINDIWKSNPDKNLTEVICFDDSCPDEKLEKYLKDELRRLNER